MKIALSSLHGLVFLVFAFALYRVIDQMYLISALSQQDDVMALFLRQYRNLDMVAIILGLFCVTHLLSAIVVAKEKYSVFVVILNYIALIIFVFIGVAFAIKLFSDGFKEVRVYVAFGIAVAIVIFYFLTGKTVRSFKKD